MKTPIRFFLSCASGLVLLGGGCMMVPDRNEPPPATKAEVQYLRDELRRMNDRLQASEAQVGDIQRTAFNAEANRPATASAAEVAALREQLDALQRQVRALDAARAADKREIYDDISKKVAEIVKKATPAAPPAKKSAPQTGYEHVVQPGETLSAIAQAYGVKMDAVLKANNIKNADAIRVGQKLFIPD
jgi:LysM repeat protein